MPDFPDGTNDSAAASNGPAFPDGTNEPVAPQQGNTGFQLLSDPQNPGDTSWQVVKHMLSRPIDTFRQHMTNQKNMNSPLSTAQMNQIEPGQGGETDPTGQKILENLQTAAGGYMLPQAAANLVNLAGKGAGAVSDLVTGGFSKVKDIINGTTDAAEALRPVEGAYQSGDAAQLASMAKAEQGGKVAEDLYSAVPKDTQIAIPSMQNEADSQMVRISKLSQSSQKALGGIKDIVSDYQQSDATSLDDLRTARRNLIDIMRKGGPQTDYAKPMLDAVNSDLEAFGRTSVLPQETPLSQQPTLEARDLRALWADTAKTQSGTSPTITSPYVTPEAFKNVGTAAPTPLTNSDIPQNLSRANKFYSYFKTLQDHPTIQAIDAAKDPAQVSNIVYGKGNVDSMRAARMWLGQDAMQGLQSQFYQKLLDAPDIGAAVQKYSRINPSFLQEALTPQQLTTLQTVNHLRNIRGGAVLAAKVAGVGTAGLGLGYEALQHLRGQ